MKRGEGISHTSMVFPVERSIKDTRTAPAAAVSSKHSWYKPEKERLIHHESRIKMAEVHMRNTHHGRFLQFVGSGPETGVEVGPTHTLGESYQSITSVQLISCMCGIYTQ